MDRRGFLAATGVAIARVALGGEAAPRFGGIFLADLRWDGHWLCVAFRLDAPDPSSAAAEVRRLFLTEHELRLQVTRPAEQPGVWLVRSYYQPAAGR